MKTSPNSARQWWHMPLIPTLRRQRQAGRSLVKASLVYKETLSQKFPNSSMISLILNQDRITSQQNQTNNPTFQYPWVNSDAEMLTLTPVNNFNNA
ncbi:hypothetical protein I79_000160 [Cricetulus griseus]|uniref:Uncharacterized protein n=1 Tax=Cricetulus griseus TaxID=10029 RepID=G3GRL1_CRIGR|nr:hypothetical protein I79_000160 [Cricetulus griseus]